MLVKDIVTRFCERPEMQMEVNERKLVLYHAICISTYLACALSISQLAYVQPSPQKSIRLSSVTCFVFKEHSIYYAECYFIGKDMGNLHKLIPANLVKEVEKKEAR